MVWVGLQIDNNHRSVSNWMLKEQQTPGTKTKRQLSMHQKNKQTKKNHPNNKLNFPQYFCLFFFFSKCWGTFLCCFCNRRDEKCTSVGPQLFFFTNFNYFAEQSKVLPNRSTFIFHYEVKYFHFQTAMEEKQTSRRITNMNSHVISWDFP